VANAVRQTLESRFGRTAAGQALTPKEWT
jgi:hypothetical protein